VSRAAWISAAAALAPLLVAGACPARSTEETAPPAVELPAATAAAAGDNPWADAVRGMLLEPCGSCHLPGLATSKPMALLVFDLDENPWYGRMSDEQLGQLGRRIGGSGRIDPLDEILVERFVACARGGSCQGQPP
jgi:hypothetical protein